MINLLQRAARALPTWLRWNVALHRWMSAGGDARRSTASRIPAVPAPVVDLAGVRRLRCLSEPCADTRLAVALLRAQRRGRVPGAALRVVR